MWISAVIIYGHFASFLSNAWLKPVFNPALKLVKIVVIISRDTALRLKVQTNRGGVSHGQWAYARSAIHSLDAKFAQSVNLGTLRASDVHRVAVVDILLDAHVQILADVSETVLSPEFVGSG